MTLTKKEQKNLKDFIRKASEKDLKHLKNLTEKKLSSTYLKDFNRVQDDVKKTLKEHYTLLLEMGHPYVTLDMLQKICLKELKIPHSYFEKAITALKRSGDIYEPKEGYLCPIDSNNIKLLAEQLEKTNSLKREK